MQIFEDLTRKEKHANLFLVTFALSVFSATFGIAKFLKSGPCRLLPNDGPIGGYGTVPFLLLMANIASTILAKGFLLTVTPGVVGCDTPSWRQRVCLLCFNQLALSSQLYHF